MFHDRVLVATLGLLLIAYLGSYLGLSRPSRCGVSMGGGTETRMTPNYRFGGMIAEQAFRPLEQLDRRLRPSYWATQLSDSVILVYESN